MSLQRACRGELARAELASKVPVLLVLQQNVSVLKLLLAVEAERLEHVDASLFSAHFCNQSF